MKRTDGTFAVFILSYDGTRREEYRGSLKACERIASLAEDNDRDAEIDRVSDDMPNAGADAFMVRLADALGADGDA